MDVRETSASFQGETKIRIKPKENRPFALIELAGPFGITRMLMIGKVTRPDKIEEQNQDLTLR